MRKEQEEETRIRESHEEEKQKLRRAEQLYQQARAKLRQLQDSDIVTQEPRRVLNRLREEVEAMTVKCNETMNKELHAKEKQFSELEDVVSSGESYLLGLLLL